MTTTEITRRADALPAFKTPVPVFTPGLTVKLTEDVTYYPGSDEDGNRRRRRVLKAGTILVISSPYHSDPTVAGWSYTPDGFAVSIWAADATVWDFR